MPPSAEPTATSGAEEEELSAARESAEAAARAVEAEADGDDDADEEEDDQSKCAACCEDCLEKYHAVCENVKFTMDDSFTSNFILSIIVLAGVLVGVQTYELDPEVTLACEITDKTITFIFLVEAVLKIFGEGPHHYRYFLDPWNVFDFFIVIMSFIFFDAGPDVMVLRLLRLMRLVKLFKAIPKMMTIVVGIFKAIEMVFYITLMMILFMFLWAVIGMILFAENDPVMFGNLHISMITLWQATTGDDWTEIMYGNMEGCDYAMADGHYSVGSTARCLHPKQLSQIEMLVPMGYFVCLIMVNGMLFLNLFIGATSMGMMEAKSDQATGQMLEVQLVRGIDLEVADWALAGGASDPYVNLNIVPVWPVPKKKVCSLGKAAEMERSKVIQNTLNPVWNETFQFSPLQNFDTTILYMEVYDWDRCGGDDPLGHCYIDFSKIAFGSPHHIIVPLQGTETGHLELIITKHKDATGGTRFDALLEHLEELTKIVPKTFDSYHAMKQERAAEELKLKEGARRRSIFRRVSGTVESLSPRNLSRTMSSKFGKDGAKKRQLLKLAASGKTAEWASPDSAATKAAPDS